MFFLSFSLSRHRRCFRGCGGDGPRRRRRRGPRVRCGRGARCGRPRPHPCPPRCGACGCGGCLFFL